MEAVGLAILVCGGVIIGRWDDGAGEGDCGRSKSIPKKSEAGGPTGTMREPNSTPIVTSWDGEKRPSQRRMVSWANKG